MRYIIIDDEHIAHDIIKNYCDLLPNMQLLHNCYDALEAIAFLSKNSVDLIFLDLNMPKLKGFDFLKTLVNPPQVIVTTAYQEHAIEGYELNIVDYLLKPFSFERFIKAINKVKIEESTLNNSAFGKSKDSIFFRSNKKYVQVQIQEIKFIEALGNYCKIITSNNILTIREKLSDVLKLLPQDQFFQVHKSFIIAKQHVNEIEGNNIRIAKHNVPIGKMYRANIKEFLR